MWTNEPSKLFDGPHYNKAEQYARVQKLQDAYPLTVGTAKHYAMKLLANVLDGYTRSPPTDQLLHEIIYFICLMYGDNGVASEMPPIEQCDRDYLDRKEFILNPSNDHIKKADEILGQMILRLIRDHTPDCVHGEEREGGIQVPMVNLMHDPAGFMEHAYIDLVQDLREKYPLFARTGMTLHKNVFNFSGIPLDDPKPKKKTIAPSESELDLTTMVDTYFANTPFKELLMMPAQFQITDDARYEHTHILGPSGSGKTTLIQQIILDDLKREVPPAMVIIDPKGLMVDRISRLDIFNPEHGRLKDKLVIIDPLQKDVPALSMFKVGGDRRVLNNAIENFRYIFSQAKAPLTQKMDPLFTYCVRLLFFMGNANIFTFMDLLSDDPKKSKFMDAIGRMSEEDEGAKRFFEDYYRATYSETRQSVKTRLYEVISKPGIMAMFNAATLNVDMWDCLQNGKIVLVNTAMSELTNAAHQLLGRYMISLTLNAAYRRTTVPKDQWNPAFLYIDEFQDFADEDKTPKMLRLAREYNLGITLAHQNMFCTELNESMRSAISTNTTVKYCASPEGADRNIMARDLRCEPEFLAAQVKDKENVRFACLVRNTLSAPISVTIPIGGISKEPQMSNDAHKTLIAANAEAVKSQPVVKAVRPEVKAASPEASRPRINTPEPDDDSKLW